MIDRWKRGGWSEPMKTQSNSFPIGPINTFSNIVYPVIGVYAYLVNDALLFALCMVWLGVGSFAYHGWHEHWGEAMDDSGMWAVLGLFAVGAWQGAAFGAIFGFVNWMPKFKRRMMSHRAIIKVSFAIIALQVWIVGWKAVLLFAAAYFLWTKGKGEWDAAGNPVPQPEYTRWCHGLWHLLTSVGFYLLYLVYA